ncbi:MAG: MBL fold metallo-hydrolase [Chloroflexi bacterium]|nr:MBL fold metallo-hydrolase [Chloroflexota bacterium]
MQQISENVYTFTGLPAGRVYGLVDSDGLTLIDTSVAPAAKRILKQLAARGYQPKDVKRILITHAHPDHVGGLPHLKEATGAEIWASALEKRVIQGEIPIPTVKARIHPPNMTLKPVAVERELADGDTLPEILGGLQVVATFGHAPGHISFWHPEKRILFTGDVIFYIPRKMRLPFAFLTVDMDENRRSITKIAALEPKIICFGHGKPIIENAAEQLRVFAQKYGLPLN